MNFSQLNQNKYFETIILTILFFTTLTIHSINLWTEPFWYDEIVSVKTSLLDFGHIKHVSEWDNNPPFYYYCLWLWTKITGISEYNIRFLNVIITSFSVVILFKLVRMKSDFIAALFSSLFLILHNFALEYSHEARAYSLTLLLVLISTLLFFKFLETPKTYIAVLLGVVNFLVMYTHYIAGLSLLLQSVFLLLFYKNKLKLYTLNWLVIGVLVFLRFTKKQFILLFSFNKSSKSFWLQKADTELLKETLSQLFSESWTWYLLLSLTVLSIIQLLLQVSKKTVEAYHLSLYSIIVGIGSIALLYILGIFTPVFLGRYLIFTLPFFGIIIANLWLTSQTKYRNLLYGIVIVTMIYNVNLHPLKKMDYKSAVLISQKLKSNNNPIFIQTKDLTSLYAYYYDRNTFLNYQKTAEILKTRNIYEIENYSDFQKISLGNPQKVVFCQVYDKPEESSLIYKNLYDLGYKYNISKTVKGVKISLFTR